MFCPKGFRQFQYVAEYARKIGLDFHLNVLAPEVRTRVSERDAFRKELKKLFPVSGLLERWLVDYALFIQPVPIYASHPSGGLVRVGHQIAMTGDNISRYSFEWPIVLDDEMERFLSPTTEAHEWCYSPQYPLIDEELWQITVSEDPRFLKRARNVSTIVEDLRTAVKAIDGWFLCVEESDVQILTQALDEEYHSFRGAPPEAGKPRGPGRTRKQDGVLEAYKILFPDGHGNLTLKEIAAQLREHVPYPFEVDTLRRALRQRP